MSIIRQVFIFLLHLSSLNDTIDDGNIELSYYVFYEGQDLENIGNNFKICISVLGGSCW